LVTLVPDFRTAAPTLMLTCFPEINAGGMLGNVSEPHWFAR
jgi:hypothetical protein